MLVSELLAKIDPGVKKTVEDTQRQYNRLLRDALRDELRLSLSRRDEQQAESEQEGVQCVVDVGASEEVMNIRIPDELRLAAKLSLHRVALEQMARGNCDLAEVLAHHEGAVEQQLHAPTPRVVTPRGAG